MDETLKNFLISRRISAETINYMENEKVDCTTIPLLEKTKMVQLFPKLGDRIAIIEFCKRQSNPSKKRKNTLLERLREKIRKRKNESKHSGSDSNGDSESDKESNLTSVHKPNYHTKSERSVLVGWICETETGKMKQVRTKQGGGTRKISVSKAACKKDVITLAKSLFFPSGQSNFGDASQFSFNLSDFCQNEIDDSVSVNEMFKLTGLPILRFYLITQRKKESPDVSCSFNNNKRMETIVDIESSANSENSVYDEIIVSEHEYSFHEENEVFEITDREKELTSIDPSIECINEDSTRIPVSQLDNDTISLNIHRGHEFKELLKIFIDFPVEVFTRVNLKMILPNGEEEKGIDAGGIWRDCLTEFWIQFSEICTEGTNTKVPCIRHDFQEKEWTAAAAILKKGWNDEKYFPIFLSPPFVEQAVFGQTFSNLKDCFMSQLSFEDAEVLRKADEKFPCEGDEHEELLEVLNNFGCKRLPSKENIKALIQEIAHKEIIQKPQFIIDCWNKVLGGVFDIDSYQKILQEGKPTSKNILKFLMCDAVLDVEKKTSFDFLKRFIKEVDDDTRSRFLRFCTGSNIVNKTISVTLLRTRRFNRHPVGHVCSCVLELPYPYETYQDFRKEFNSILSSNIWVMDIV